MALLINLYLFSQATTHENSLMPPQNARTEEAHARTACSPEVDGPGQLYPSEVTIPGMAIDTGLAPEMMGGYTARSLRI